MTDTKTAEVVDLLDEIAALTKALTGLTCSGSEFFIRKGDRYTADVPACVDYVRKTREMQHRIIVREITARREAEATITALRERIEGAQSAFWKIKIALNKELIEPGRTAFWIAVDAFEALRAALKDTSHTEGEGS